MSDEALQDVAGKPDHLATVGLHDDILGQTLVMGEVVFSRYGELYGKRGHWSGTANRDKHKKGAPV